MWTPFQTRSEKVLGMAAVLGVARTFHDESMYTYVYIYIYTYIHMLLYQYIISKSSSNEPLPAEVSLNIQVY